MFNAKEIKMRKLNWICIIVILFSFMITACNKKENTDKNMVPVKYNLSDQDKSLLEYYYDNPSITYLDQDNQELVFTTDSLYNLTEKEEGNLRNGEELIIRYNCITEYFPDYSFVVTLLAIDTSTVSLEIMFGTGTYWNDQGNDYVLSNFIIDPKIMISIDTVFPNNYILKFDYYDSITLRSNQFYDVYHIANQIINTDIAQTKNCYYTNKLGLIAFENLDNKFWIRKAE